MTDKPRPKIALIRWHDAVQHTGWQSVVGNTPLPAETVGFVVAEDEHTITLALNRALCDPFKPWGELYTIPRGMVVSVEELQCPKN